MSCATDHGKKTCEHQQETDKRDNQRGIVQVQIIETVEIVERGVQPHHHEYAETPQDIQAEILSLHEDTPFSDEMAIVIGLSEGYPEIDKKHNDEQVGKEARARGDRELTANEKGLRLLRRPFCL
jgi:hypothetical protein